MHPHLNRESCGSRSKTPTDSYSDSTIVVPELPTLGPHSFSSSYSTCCNDNSRRDSYNHPSTSSLLDHHVSRSAMFPVPTQDEYRTTRFISVGIPYSSDPDELFQTTPSAISQTGGDHLNSLVNPQTLASYYPLDEHSAQFPHHSPSIDYNQPSTSGPSPLDISAPPDRPTRSRKTRREKPRLELAPDQPLTTQGTPRARVYVACAQWYVLSRNGGQTARINT